MSLHLVITLTSTFLLAKLKLFSWTRLKDDADQFYDIFTNQSLNFPAFYDCSYAIRNHRVISFLWEEESVLRKGKCFPCEWDNDGSIVGCYAPLAHHTTIHMLNSKNNKYFQTKLQPTASIMTAVSGKLVPPIQAIQHTWTQPRMPRTCSMAVAREGERLCLSLNHDWERQWCVFCKTQWVVL